MEQRLSHDFDMPAARLWSRYFHDEAFARAFFSAVGLEPKDLTVTTDDSGVVTRVLVLDSARRLPGVLERVVGPMRRTVQRERWDPLTHRVDVDVDLPVIGGRTDFSGHYATEPLPCGGCRRTWTASVHVRLPLVGARVEAYICEEIAATLTGFHRFAHTDAHAADASATAHA